MMIVTIVNSKADMNVPMNVSNSSSILPQRWTSHASLLPLPRRIIKYYEHTLVTLYLFFFLNWVKSSLNQRQGCAKVPKSISQLKKQTSKQKKPKSSAFCIHILWVCVTVEQQSTRVRRHAEVSPHRERNRQSKDIQELAVIVEKIPSRKTSRSALLSLRKSIVRWHAGMRSYHKQNPQSGDMKGWVLIMKKIPIQKTPRNMFLSMKKIPTQKTHRNAFLSLRKFIHSWGRLLRPRSWGRLVARTIATPFLR